MSEMNKKNYTAEFKAQALAKVFARPGDQGINEIAAGLHMNTGTLKGWMRTATRAQKSLSPSTVRAADFSLAERLLALHETHGMSEEALQGWCRQRGVFARDLAQWREAFWTLGGREARQQEALALSKGEFISMVATDDIWEPNKIAVQLAAMRAASDDVAVVYSDASQIDEQSVRLPLDFMGHHRPGFAAPSGDVFPALADGNFIPAMATLIRTSAIAAVGGYDERLTYEDYDMWLRLAARFHFMFVLAALARYRHVATSMVRTVFVAPTAAHCHTQFLIREKFIDSGKLDAGQRARWIDSQASAAYGLYVHGDARASTCLWASARRSGIARFFLLAAAGSVGLTRTRARRLAGLLGRRND